MNASSKIKFTVRMADQRGAETRTQILPSSEPKGIDFLGPNYSYTDNLIQPQAIGVRKEGSLGAVLDGIRGVGYYVDTIAFGESSNLLTRGMPFTRYGVNYFIKNGAKCSNGADAWTYMELIPRGDSFGENVRKAVAGIGVAELRGLAPGVIEDAKRAMDPAPILKSLMGSGYARCELEPQPVGDAFGRIQSPQGDSYVDDPSTVQIVNGRSFQTKWVAKEFIDKAAYDAEKKTINPDGTEITQSPREGFSGDDRNTGYLVLMAALLGLANIWIYKTR